MKNLALIAVLALSTLFFAQSEKPKGKSTTMQMHAAGTFDVKITPVPLEDKAADPSLARMTIDKQFHGDLAASSKGEMLSAGSPASGSGGYVAIERVVGKLGDRSGAFALQHLGTMTKGATELSVTVVPGSGTGDLKGVVGKMTIKIEGGKHFYEFDYTISPDP